MLKSNCTTNKESLQVKTKVVVKLAFACNNWLCFVVWYYYSNALYVEL